jgi:intein/homing endonuclease
MDSNRIIQTKETFKDSPISGRCLVAGTPVETASGDKPIETVAVGEEVYGLNSEFIVVKARVSARKRNPASATWRLVTADGQAVTATADHPFLVLQQGARDKTLAWRPLSEIKAGDQVACVRNDEGVREVYFSKVDGIGDSDWRETYDLEVDGGHNFLANGVVVHNSQITMKYPSCFIEPFTKELPLEYAFELNRLIQLEMTGSGG